MFAEVYPLLKLFDDPDDDWKNVFDYSWHQEEEYCGYGLYENQEIIGFIGLIFNQRLIDGKIERFCNIHSWKVKENYRDYSLFLLRPVLKLKNYTITDLTPSSAVCGILKQLGFQELDSKLIILLPLQIFPTLRHSDKVHFIRDLSTIANRLKGEDLKIFQDHKSYKCHHLLMADNQDYCHVIYTKIQTTKLPYCHLQYISNLAVFSRYSLGIRHAIVNDSKTPFVIVDSRLIQAAKLPFAYRLPFRWIRLYKSANLKPNQIDNLYSENILLNLGNVPSLFKIRQELSRKAFHFFRDLLLLISKKKI